jgi:nickel-type superoxide dismutase maturation protease
MGARARRDDGEDGEATAMTAMTARWRRAGAGAVALVYFATLAVNRSLVEVRGRSMEPALWPGDRLVTVPARGRRLRAGQVVVVADPHDTSHLVVKRVSILAAEGRVEVSGDNLAASTDSRVWGPLPRSAVRRVVVRRWPDLRTRLRRG